MGSVWRVPAKELLANVNYRRALLYFRLQEPVLDRGDFTPTSGSWLNLVERLFGEVTERCVRRGSHTAVRSLEKAMLDYLDQRNQNPKPFVWTADADLILGKIERLSKRISRSGH